MGVIAAEDGDAELVAEAQCDEDALFMGNVENTFMGYQERVNMFTTTRWERALEQAGFEVEGVKQEAFQVADRKLKGRHEYTYITAQKRE